MAYEASTEDISEASSGIQEAPSLWHPPPSAEHTTAGHTEAPAAAEPEMNTSGSGTASDMSGLFGHLADGSSWLADTSHAGNQLDDNGQVTPPDPTAKHGGYGSWIDSMFDLDPSKSFQESWLDSLYGDDSPGKVKPGDGQGTMLARAGYSAAVSPLAMLAVAGGELVDTIAWGLPYHLNKNEEIEKEKYAEWLANPAPSPTLPPDLVAPETPKPQVPLDPNGGTSAPGGAP
jgi:hypothetical protein